MSGLCRIPSFPLQQHGAACVPIELSRNSWPKSERAFNLRFHSLPGNSEDRDTALMPRTMADMMSLWDASIHVDDINCSLCRKVFFIQSLQSKRMKRAILFRHWLSTTACPSTWLVQPESTWRYMAGFKYSDSFHKDCKTGIQIGCGHVDVNPLKGCMKMPCACGLGQYSTAQLPHDSRTSRQINHY